MALPTVTAPPVAPTTEDPTTFASRADALVAWLATHATEEAALVAWMSDQISALNSLFAGGGFALPYYFDSVTTDADPGAGKIRFSSATQASSGTVRIDLTTGASQDATALLDDMTSSTSAVKGKMRIVKANDPTKWMVFNVTAKASPTGYRNISATPIQYSSTSPFTNGDPLIVFFTPNGDKGDTGNTGPAYSYPVLHVREEQAGNSADSALTATAFSTRTLNTVKSNTISGASVASNIITLPAGDYYVEAWTTTRGGSGVTGQARLRNTADNTTLIPSPPFFGTGAANLFPLRGRFTLAAAKTIALQIWVSASGIDGGESVGAGETNVYSDVYIQKVN